MGSARMPVASVRINGRRRWGTDKKSSQAKSIQVRDMDVLCKIPILFQLQIGSMEHGARRHVGERATGSALVWLLSTAHKRIGTGCVPRWAALGLCFALLDIRR